MYVENWRKAADPLWQASLVHPFVEELASGNLPAAKFRNYLIQDAHYLRAFTRLFWQAGSLTERKKYKVYLQETATRIDESEIAIRETFFSELGITSEEVDQTEIAPATYHYTSHLEQQLASGQLARVLASLLPCSWLYQEIGDKLTDVQSPVPLYQTFIESYQGPNYAKIVTDHKAVMEELAQETPAAEQADLGKIFLISSFEELEFWNMAYSQQTWEVKQ